MRLGGSLSLDQAAAETRQPTEGVKSAEAIVSLARTHGVYMPITEIVTAVLYERSPSPMPPPR